MELLKSLDAGLGKLLRWVTIALFIALGTLLLLNVLLRLANDLAIFLTAQGYEGLAASVKALVPIVSFHWFDEIVELCFASLVFYGAAALWRTKGHFSIGDWISSRLPGKIYRAVYRTLVSLFSVVFMAIFFWFSLMLTVNATELSTVFQIPKSVMYSCMPIASMIMLFYALADTVRNVRDVLTGRDDAEILGGQSL